MSGIVGIWNRDGRPVDPALVARLSATLAHRGPDGEGTWIEGPVGLACQQFRVTPEAAREVQPSVHPGSGAVIVFDGRLDDRDDLVARLGRAGVTTSAPDPELALAAYEVHGERFVERLVGDFALALFDYRQHRLFLARDAIGLRPLYYGSLGQSFLFGSEIKVLLAHPAASPRPNDDLLADFLLLHRLQERGGATFFEDVFAVPPGHVVVVAPDKLAARRYWDFDRGAQVRLQSFQDYVEGFRHHLERAVSRRLRSAYPVAVSVSGGLDSSAIFCLAETLARRDSARHARVVGASYTFPDGAPSDEKSFLAEIERHLGVTIERVAMLAPGLLDGAKEAVWHIEAPLLDAQWNGTQTFFWRLRERGARTVLTGHWGDQLLFDQSYLVDLTHRLRWATIVAHLAEYPRWLDDVRPWLFRRRFLLDLLKHHVPDALHPPLRRLRARIFRARQRDVWYARGFRRRARWRPSSSSGAGVRFATAHAQALYEEARAAGHVVALEWSNKVAAMHGLETALPFLDRDLVAFLMAIPGEVQTWRGVPKALLREAVHGTVPDSIAVRRWKADFTERINEGVTLDYPQVERHLLSDPMAARLGYLDRDGVAEQLGRLRLRIQGPTCEVSWLLADLLGLELWLQAFFGQKEDRG